MKQVNLYSKKTYTQMSPWMFKVFRTEKLCELVEIKGSGMLGSTGGGVRGGQGCVCIRHFFVLGSSMPFPAVGTGF